MKPKRRYNARLLIPITVNSIVFEPGLIGTVSEYSDIERAMFFKYPNKVLVVERPIGSIDCFTEVPDGSG